MGTRLDQGVVFAVTLLVFVHRECISRAIKLSCAERGISWRLKAVVILVVVGGEGWEWRSRKRGGLGLKRRAIGKKRQHKDQDLRGKSQTNETLID